MSIDIVSIYDPQNIDIYYSALYQLLGERQPYEAISHSGMPTWKQHEEFINTKPYRGWYVIVDIDVTYKEVLGSIYLSYTNEIGIAIFNKHRRKGLATEAIKLLMDRHNQPYYLANINPVNEKSISLFQQLDFKHIQNTYKLERKKDVVS